jgi:hypothetical protein
MIKYHFGIEQGSPEWAQIRCGILTASEMKLICTPTLKIASNDKERSHLYELLAQRITGYVEPQYIGFDMLRGKDDEILAREAYGEHYGLVDEVGFVTNTDHGFTIGYSPDGLVGDEGLIECKSRRQKFQTETIITREVPDEYVLQCQTGLLVTQREWIDLVSYCGGMHMIVLRVYPDEKIQNAIIEAASAFEERLEIKLRQYHASLASDMRLIPTERVVEQEMV